MPQDYISPIRAKIKRAKKHISDLNTCIGDFIKSGANSIVIDDDSEPGQRIYRMRVTKLAHEEWPVILGDAVQNLRTSLDHLACACVLHNGGSFTDIEKFKTYFPITGYPVVHELASKDTKVKGLSQAAVDLLNTIKPYKGGSAEGDMLWLLHTINNTDKHRLLLVCAVQSAHVAFDIVPPQLRGILPTFLSPARTRITSAIFQDGAELFRWPVLMAKMNMDPQFSVGVLFNEPGVLDRKPIFPTLPELAELVDGIVTSFEPVLA